MHTITHADLALMTLIAIAVAAVFAVATALLRRASERRKAVKLEGLYQAAAGCHVRPLPQSPYLGCQETAANTASAPRASQAGGAQPLFAGSQQ